jgi:hypothetical protein
MCRAAPDGGLPGSGGSGAVADPDPGSSLKVRREHRGELGERRARQQNLGMAAMLTLSPASLGQIINTVLLRHRRLICQVSLPMIIGLVLCGCAGGGTARTTDARTLAVLTCRDSPGQQGLDGAPALLVNGVDGFIGDTNAYDSLPVWGNLEGRRYLAWKTGLAVAPGARPYRTVSVLSPSSARLVYGLPAKIASRQVRLPSCGRRYTLFAGDILVTRPACVTLAVAGPAGKPTVVAVPVLVAHC